MSPGANDASEVRGTRETVETFLRLVGEGDADRLADAFAEEIDWSVPGDGSLPWTGRRSHRHEVPEYFKVMWPTFVESESETAIDNILVDGADAVVLGRFSHTVKANGRRFGTPVAIHLTVRHGSITRLHLYEDTYTVAKAVTAEA
ncbi:nuclear transport factor 2 family protein [Wenjunlia tyrosinilytica]|uniref:nuclear transport factor 2 family protein n=1 Tax=Wenjunlia tyrosinilytica TaxID=1544741 RepID=UPI001E2E3A36|nr:nuclear transport factor 2 family protein [Wenjunlia tyrosinilytica]